MEIKICNVCGKIKTSFGKVYIAVATTKPDNEFMLFEQGGLSTHIRLDDICGDCLKKEVKRIGGVVREAIKQAMKDIKVELMVNGEKLL